MDLKVFLGSSNEIITLGFDPYVLISSLGPLPVPHYAVLKNCPFCYSCTAAAWLTLLPKLCVVNSSHHVALRTVNVLNSKSSGN